MSECKYCGMDGMGRCQSCGAPRRHADVQAQARQRAGSDNLYGGLAGLAQYRPSVEEMARRNAGLANRPLSESFFTVGGATFVDAAALRWPR